MKRLLPVVASALMAVLSCTSPLQDDVTLFVDPFIGTAAHGHVFPGATTPFGMVQLSPDNGTSGWDWCSGYNYSDSLIAGFSHTHLSGTGIGDLCDILFLPSMYGINITLPDSTYSLAKLNRTLFSHEAEQARPGYYAVALSSGVDAELTATPRCGVQRYTAVTDGTMSILVDLGFAINWDRPVDCRLAWDGRALTGRRISSGWAEKQYLYFSSEFSAEPASVTMLNAGSATGTTATEGRNIACILAFTMKKGEELIIRTGISAVDETGARGNIAAEMTGWDFDAVAAEARQAWQKRLHIIRAESADSALLRVFYTALYHTMIAPNLYNDSDGTVQGH